MAQNSTEAGCGASSWWTSITPGPWAALVWVPLMLAAPVAYVGDSVLGWVSLVVLAAAAVTAILIATAGTGGRSLRSDMLLVIQAVASVAAATALPADNAQWLWVLLGLTVGAVARPRDAPWAILAAAGLSAVWLGRAEGWGGAVGGGFTVLAAGFGTCAFYRLLETVDELRRTRAELAAAAVREERLRLSRDLHDLLGHSLSLIVVKAEAVRRIGPRDPEAVVSHATDIEAIGRQALAEVRQTVAGYRGNGLADELARAEDSLRAAGVRLVLEAPDPMPPAVAADATLGWVVREAVTNVLRHARATSCRVTVHVAENHVEVAVADDGVGRPDQPTDGTTTTSGMQGLAERLQSADGTLRVDGAPGRGTRVTARVPLECTRDGHRRR